MPLVQSAVDVTQERLLMPLNIVGVPGKIKGMELDEMDAEE